MDKLNYIIFIQLRVKFLHKMKTKKCSLYNDLYGHIEKLMNRNEINVQLKIISSYTYNIVNNELYKIIETYKSLKLDDHIIKFNNIINELTKITNKIGTKKFNDIYFYYNINYKNTNIIDFLDAYFNPTKIYIYSKNVPSHEYDMSCMSCMSCMTNSNVIQYSKLKKKI